MFNLVNGNNICVLFLIRDHFLYNNVVLHFTYIHIHTFFCVVALSCYRYRSVSANQTLLVGFVQTQYEAKTTLKICTLSFFESGVRHGLDTAQRPNSYN